MTRMDIRFIYVLFGITIGAVRVDASCSDPPAIPGGEYTTSGSAPFPENTAITYSCMPGYREAGTSRTYICTDGNWVGDYRCDLIYCGYINPPDNGRVVGDDPTYAVGTQIRFTCNVGYTRVGASTLTCRTDRRWVPAKPRCDVIMCGEFGAIDNADLFQETGDGILNDYGSTVRVTCNANHVLFGSAIVSCGADGQWGQRPTCEQVTCPPYPGSNSSCIDVTHLTPDKTFYMMCEDNSVSVSVTHVGPDHAECRNGRWNDVTMACYCDCKLFVDPAQVSLNNVAVNSFLKHGETLNWHCLIGDKSTTSPISCDDGRLNAVPNCLVPTTQLISTTHIMTRTRQKSHRENIGRPTSRSKFQTRSGARNASKATEFLWMFVVLGFAELIVFLF